MKSIVFLISHFLLALMKIMRPGGSKAMIAENIALRHQFMVSMRYRKRAPNLSTADRVLYGLLGSFISHN